MLSARVVIAGSVFVTIAVAIGLVLALITLPSQISAEDILDDAEEANATVKTYRFTMAVSRTQQDPDDPPTYETHTRGTVVFDQGMHVIMTGRGFESFYGEALFLDGKQYERDSADGRWEELPSTFDTDKMLELDPEAHFRIVDGLIDQTVVGKETLRGIEVTKVTGWFDLEKRARIIWGDPDDHDPEAVEGFEDPRSQMIAGTEEFTGWVGVEDGLLHAFEVRGTYPEKGELLAYTLTYRVDYTDFDGELTLPSVNE